MNIECELQGKCQWDFLSLNIFFQLFSALTLWTTKHVVKIDNQLPSHKPLLSSILYGPPKNNNNNSSKCNSIQDLRERGETLKKGKWFGDGNKE